MIKHNINCIKNKNLGDLLEDDEIVGNIYAFQFAGFDTSLNATTSGLMNVCQSSKEWFGKISDSGVDTVDQILSNKNIEIVMYEILRLFNPAPCNFPRKVIKDFTVDNIELKKGDWVAVPIGYARNKDNQFIDDAKFRPERFLEEVPKLENCSY